MTTAKKNAKSKFISNDINEIVSESEFLQKSPIIKKTQKRPKPVEEDDNSKFVGQHQVLTKKKKVEANVEASKQSRQKILTVMDQQLKARQTINEKILKCLSVIMTQLDKDCSLMKENEQKLENLMGVIMKFIQQSISAYTQKFKALKELHDSFKKQCEEMQSEQKAEAGLLADELEEDIKKLQQKLVQETKRSGWEAMRRSIFNAMQNDF